MQRDMRPLSVTFSQTTDGVKTEDFFAKIIEMVLWVLHFVSHGLPLLAQFVEQHVQLMVFGACEPEPGFEVLDAEVDDLVLRRREILLNSRVVVFGFNWVLDVFGQARPRADDRGEGTVGSRQRLADLHDIGESPTAALPPVDEQDRGGHLENANRHLNGDANEERLSGGHTVSIG